MMNLIVIGGPSRVGKTTLANRLRHDIPFSVRTLHLDDFMRYCKETFGVATNLHDEDWETPILFADKCHGRDAIVCWMAMGGIIEEARMSDSDTVLMTEGNWWPDAVDAERLASEGIRALPIWLYRLSEDSDAEYGTIRCINENDPDGSWLSNRSDEALRAYGGANLERSKRYAKLAKEAGSDGDGTLGYYDTTRWGTIDECLDGIVASVIGTILDPL